MQVANPVGQLQELATKMRWAPPKYDFVTQEEIPHTRVFTVKCSLEEDRAWPPKESGEAAGRPKNARVFPDKNRNNCGLY